MLQMNKRLGVGLAIGFLLSYAASAGAVPIPQIDASDPISQFTVGTGVYSTDDGTGDAVGEQPASVLQTEVHVEFDLETVESDFSIGTRFVGTADATPDIWIWDGANTLLTADIVFVDVSNVSVASDSITFGSTDGTFIKSQIILTGGTLANDFGGVGALGEILMLVENTTLGDLTFASLGSLFAGDFTAQTNIAMQFYAPEPNTLALLASGLVGLVALGLGRRRT
jgi:hypothetical protein